MASPSTIPASPPGRRDEQPPPTADLGRLLVGATVLALGTLLLLDAAGVLDAGRAASRWWPAVIVAGGLASLVERPASLYRGLVLIGIGSVLLLVTTGTVDEGVWAYVWPAAIVLAGIAIIARWRGRSVAGRAREESDDVIRATGVLGGPHVASASQNFRGAWLTAVLGGVQLDLRGAEMAPKGASINATVFIGGAEILVPRGWRISVRCTPILGGVDDKTDKTIHPPPDAPVLRIDAVALLGGVEIKHEE